LAEFTKYGAPTPGLEATKNLIEMFEQRPSETTKVK
jgi:hypothetical protein